MNIVFLLTLIFFLCNTSIFGMTVVEEPEQMVNFHDSSNEQDGKKSRWSKYRD